MRAGHVGSPAEQRERLETQVIRSLLVSYFSIVKKNLQDSVPKAIMHFLVNAVRREIQNELVGELYKDGYFDEMLQHEEAAERRRQHCVEVVRGSKATEVLAELKAMRPECREVVTWQGEPFSESELLTHSFVKTTPTALPAYRRAPLPRGEGDMLSRDVGVYPDMSSALATDARGAAAPRWWMRTPASNSGERDRLRGLQHCDEA